LSRKQRNTKQKKENEQCEKEEKEKYIEKDDRMFKCDEKD